MLNMTAWKWNKLVCFEKVKHTLSEKIRDDANVVPEVKRVPKMNALVSVRLVVGSQGCEYSKLNFGGISVLLHGADDLDGHLFPASAVKGFDHLAECALSK